jgi:vacuolar-type H+-ATPase subunit I/STV1
MSDLSQSSTGSLVSFTDPRDGRYYGRLLAFARKIMVAVILCFFSQLMIVVQAQDAKTEEIIKQMEEYNKLLNPSAKQKVMQSSKSLGGKIFASDKNADIYAISVSSIKNQYRGLSSLDIDALVMLVMFDIWKSGEEDLKELINEMDKMNEAKKNQREYLERLKKQKIPTEKTIKNEYKTTTAITPSQKKVDKPVLLKESANTPLLNIKYTRTPKLPVLKDPGQMSAIELEQAINTTNANLSTLEEIDQLDQMALQDAMQKQAQLLQLMSNISKMLHDTLKGIIQNLK